MSDDRHLRLRRARPMLALAGVSFAIGVIVGAQGSSSARDDAAKSFVRAWTHGDYAAMYQRLDADSQRHTTPGAFADAYRRALATATATSAQLTGRPRDLGGDAVSVPVRVHTRLFGTLPLAFELALSSRGGEAPRIAWTRSMTFPGLHPGERLTRTITLPPRATLLAADGTVLAEGSPQGSSEQSRSSPLGTVARAVVGSVGPPPAARRAALEAEGVPPNALVGVSGLEEALDSQLRGTPGGELLAKAGEGGEGRVLAAVAPHAARPVHSTVSPSLQRTAVEAVGGQLGAVVVMAPASGQILAVAGIGLDGLQPPGSTFKMVTVTGVLQAHIAFPGHVFPYASYAVLDGVKLNNANGENCGGTLALAFAVSCNSVFAPLGVRLGAPRLVATAEALGFNRDPGVAGAAESTLPAASKIQGELDVGSTAIGQGQVLATPLEMALVAATIADGGRRPQPTFQPGAHAPLVRAMDPAVARTVRRLMIGVVREGTGTAAAIPGVTVAGKTGTAELKTPCQASAGSEGGEGCQSEGESSNTDAWFAAFAPALHPRVVVCVLLVKGGAGGAAAAPVARQVLEAGLAAVH